MQKRKPVKTVSEYIALYPPEVRKRLNLIRKIIKTSAPGSEEKISYLIPAYTLNGVLIYFAAFRDHISLYPYTKGLTAIKELTKHRSGKGTIKFLLDRPLSPALIRKIVKLRVKENLERRVKH